MFCESPNPKNNLGLGLENPYTMDFFQPKQRKATGVEPIWIGVVNPVKLVSLDNRYPGI